MTRFLLGKCHGILRETFKFDQVSWPKDYKNVQSLHNRQPFHNGFCKLRMVVSASGRLPQTELDLERRRSFQPMKSVGNCLDSAAQSNWSSRFSITRRERNLNQLLLWLLPCSRVWRRSLIFSFFAFCDLRDVITVIERFSMDYGKLVAFVLVCISSLRDWPAKCAPLFQPRRSTTIRFAVTKV